MLAHVPGLMYRFVLFGDVNSKWPRRDGLKWLRRGLNCPGGWGLRGRLVRVVGVVPGLPDFGAESTAVGHG